VDRAQRIAPGGLVGKIDRPALGLHEAVQELLVHDRIAAASRAKALAFSLHLLGGAIHAKRPARAQIMPASTAGGEVEVRRDEVRAATSEAERKELKGTRWPLLKSFWSKAPPARWGELPRVHPSIDCARVEQLVQPVSLPYPRHRRSAIIRT
jgi:hypothetical protein